MAISFPANPAVGDRHSDAAQTWEWNGTNWDIVSPDMFSEYDPTRTYEVGESFIWPGRTNAGASHVYEVLTGPTTPGQNPQADPTLFVEVMSATGRMRGYALPNLQNGGVVGGTIPGRIIDGDPDNVYDNADYLICLSDSDQLYDSSTGTPTSGPTATGLRVFRGDRLSINAFGIWEKVTPPEPTAWGLFDATQPGGGSAIPQPVINDTKWWQQYDHCIVATGGRYNFATGLPDPASEMLIQGQLVVFNGIEFVPTRSVEQRMIGFFDPNQAGGGNDVPDPIIDGSLAYSAGEYAIANAAGSYDFATGLPSQAVTARLVNPSDHMLYDGLVWSVLTAANSPARGFMNPTLTNGMPPAPFPVVDNTPNYSSGDYLFAEAAGTYNFATGVPGTGTVLTVGDKIVYSGASWLVQTFANGLIKGQFDATFTNGGARVDFPVRNGSTDYKSRDMVLAITSGWYNFGTGQPGVSGGSTWVRKGFHYAYNGATWLAVPMDGSSNWGWFDPSVAGGGTDFPAVTNSQTAYADSDWFTVQRAGNYDFVTGAPSPTGTALGAGDVIRRDVANSRWEIYSAGAASGTQTFDVTQNAHGFAVGQPISLSSTGTWAKAQANNENNLKEATVAEVTSANTFKAMTSGLLRMPAHGLIRSATYYVSAATAGGYLTTIPTQVNQFVQPHLVPISLDEVFINDGQVVRRL